MRKIYTGKVIAVGRNVDTDQIYPGPYLELTDPREIGSHCLSGIDPAIAPAFPTGGIVVAGPNFGCGSSREHAAIALINMGAALVLADSFARIFYRNAINLGLPLVVCRDISRRVISGQTLEADVGNGRIRVLETGETFSCEPLGGQALKILEAGGIKPLLRGEKA